MAGHISFLLCISLLLRCSLATQPYAESFFFLNIGDQENYNDIQTLFDACAFFPVNPLPDNTAYLGQNDPGDCSVTLSSDCRTALKERLVEAAESVIQNPPVPLHAGILPSICYDIASQLSPTQGHGQDFPKECWNEFGVKHEGVSLQPLALTGPNRLTHVEELGAGPGDNMNVFPTRGGLYYNCPTFDDNGEKYYWTDVFADQRYYDLAIYQAWPIFEVYFQVANDEIIPAAAGIDLTPSARLSCPRVKQVSEASINSPPAALGNANEWPHSWYLDTR